jgi:hypothetical protein
MNIFTLEIFDSKGEICTFYTVRWMDACFSETDKFFMRYENDRFFQRPLQELASFISKKIGDEMGALEVFLDLKIGTMHFHPQESSKWRIFTLTMAIFHFVCIVYEFQKIWWFCSTGAKKLPIRHRQERQV